MMTISEIGMGAQEMPTSKKTLQFEHVFCILFIDIV